MCVCVRAYVCVHVSMTHTNKDVPNPNLSTKLILFFFNLTFLPLGLCLKKFHLVFFNLFYASHKKKDFTLGLPCVPHEFFPSLLSLYIYTCIYSHEFGFMIILKQHFKIKVTLEDW